jgi:hypothetical protein
MRRIIASVTLLALPVAAFAATYASPSQLLLAANFEDKPLDLDYEAHMHVDGLDAAAWIKGSTEGNVKTGKAVIRLTVDVAQDGMTMRAKAEARIVNETMYVMLESIEGASDNPYAQIAASYAGKQWYMMPLSDVEESRGIDQEEATAVGMKIADAILTMVRTQTAPGSTYSLRLKRTAAADLKNVLMEISAQHPGLGTSSLSNKDVAELRRFLLKSNVHLKVMTDANETPTGMKFYAAYKDEKAEAVLTGMTTLRSTPVTVGVPAGAVEMGGNMLEMPRSSSTTSGTPSASRNRRVPRPLRRR